LGSLIYIALVIGVILIIIWLIRRVFRPHWWQR
jgi:flagellar biogenesis protein FliO